MTRRSSRSQEWGTPKPLFKQLHREYGFTVDVCASHTNYKMQPYLTKEDNSLELDWSGERVWCNPPYHDIGPWLAKNHEPELVCYLLPARTDRNWWRRWKPIVECHYLLGRVNFEVPEGQRSSGNGGSNVLFLSGEGTEPGRERYRDAKTGLYL